MAFYLKLYGITLLGFVAIDAIWLGLVTRRFYGKYLGFLMRDTPNWGVAAAFYLLFVAGIVLFVVGPSVESGSWKKALLLGAAFGLVTYATYDLTNHATVRGWPWVVTVVDLCWGMVLGAAVGTFGYFAGKWLS